MKTCLLLLLFGLLLACSSGKTAYRRGNFTEAVAKASQRLNQKPGLGKRGHELAQEVLQRAFVQGYEQHQNAIRRLTAQTDRLFRWELVFAEYDQLQQMTTHAGQTTPPPLWLADYPADYARQLGEARQLAAGERYTAAEAAFAHRETDRQAARYAYEQYQQADHWLPGYQQTAQKQLEVFPYAVLRVLVEPPLLTPELDPAETTDLGRHVFNSLQHVNKPSPYVHLIDPNQVEEDPNGQLRLYDGFPIDERVQLATRHYVPYDESHTATTQAVESEKLYKVGTKRINDSTVVDILEKVKGTLTLHTHLIEARMLVELRAIDPKTNQILWTDEARSSTDRKVQWETFTGDDRALNGHTLLTATGQPPARWQLLSALSGSMGRSVAGTLQQRYKKR